MAEEKKERLSRQEKKEQQLEAIRKLIEEKGGVAKTSELYNLGLDYRVLQRFVEEGKLERIKSGYYSLGYHTGAVPGWSAVYGERSLLSGISQRTSLHMEYCGG